MANSYQQSSSILPIPKDKYFKALSIVEKVESDIRIAELHELGQSVTEENLAQVCLGFTAEVSLLSVWIYDDESFNPNNAEKLVVALINELEIDIPFYCSWSYTSDKLIANAFGGGAFLVRRNTPTRWIDTLTHILQYSTDITDIDTHE